jgi:hypothetical protein
MMQNSLERLFAGMAETLQDTVAPAVDDPYARSQVMAAVDLLANLASRVEWRAADQLEAINRVRDVLRSTPTEAPASLTAPLDEDLPAATDAAGLETSRRAHYAAIAEVQRWLERAEGHDPVREAVQEFVLWDLEAELGRLRSGMYRSRAKTDTEAGER